MKILYAGSPEAAAVTLKLLFEKQNACGFEIAGVLTNPPATQGRHKDLIPTPLEVLARENNIPVFTPEHLDSECRSQIEPLGCDLLVSFAYGHIFGPKFLAMFKCGGINLHPSLLPKYRGCTPVPAAILNRDDKTAVTVQSLALKMDEGNILAQEVLSLDGTETSGKLLLKSAEIGAGLIAELLKSAACEGKLPEGKVQEGEASYTGIITKADGQIDWNKSALEIDAQLRAYTPEPGIWCMDGNESLKIIEAVPKEDDEQSASEPAGKVIRFSKPEGIFIKCGKGQLCVTVLQKQGKKAMGYKDFMNGSRDFIGKQL
ncbi:MAG: methionyl-tRNA formyltransferase [Treponema sp.]|nr:methionyl-tRNA formyltransferase [Treponema sp.]